MPRFVFWNIAGRELDGLIVALAESHQPDIIVLAECKIEPGKLLQALNHGGAKYQFAFGNCTKLRFFTRFHARFLMPAFETSRISIRRLRLPARKEILVAAAHLPSKMHFSEDSMVFECAHLAREIDRQESEAGHRRTVVLGDLNANPFESAVVAAGGLHAVMSREVALRHGRTVQGREYPYFYNPMWAHFGDHPTGPPGTYYYEKAEHVSYFWNIFDQVLVRPDLLENFGSEHVEILTKAGRASLVGHGDVPDRAAASDHLPVMLTIDF